MKNTQIKNLIAKIKAGNHRFVVVTGGVCSSLGKGVLVSTLGLMLKQSGLKVSIIKCDPYLNVDPGTIAPNVHGEVFVTDDGAETDLDLGHYERMLDITLTRDSSISSGQIYKEVLEGERKGLYLGHDIQMVPDVVNVIKRRFFEFALKHKTDVTLLEIGGTVGDMEGEIFLEALRQIRWDLGDKHIVHAHLSYAPYLPWADELKTKPTQHSMICLKRSGVKPDLLFLRLEKTISEATVEKLAMLTGLKPESIFQVPTCKPVYDYFLYAKKEGVHTRLQKLFDLPQYDVDLNKWSNLLVHIKKSTNPINIGLVGKYVGSNEPYMSVVESIKIAAWHKGLKPSINEKSPESVEKMVPGDLDKYFSDCSGFVIPGGFGARGMEGKIATIRWARKNGVPTLGLCVGMHTMIIEWARSLAGLEGANSSEFDPQAKHRVIALLEEQKNVENLGGTMRLGAYRCDLVPGTRAAQAYNQAYVFERHRHRYEFNNDYKQALEQAGVVFSGIYKEKNLVEIAELKDHPFMVGVQFHPEFLSRPLSEHPLFEALVESIQLHSTKNVDQIKLAYKQNSLT